MTDDKELRETIEDISPPENFDTWEEFEKNLKFEFDEKYGVVGRYSSGVEKNARDLWEEMIDREEQTQEELEQDYWEKFDEIEETIEQDEQDIERKEQEIEDLEERIRLGVLSLEAEQDIERKEQEIDDLEEQIRLGVLSLEAEPIFKPKRKQKGIIQKVVGFFRGLFK